MNERLKEAVLHPTTLAASAVGAIASLTWLPVDPMFLTALAATVWQHAGTLFSAGSALAFVSRDFGGLAWLQPYAVGLAVASAVLYALKLLDRFLDSFREKL